MILRRILSRPVWLSSLLGLGMAFGLPSSLLSGQLEPSGSASETPLAATAPTLLAIPLEGDVHIDGVLDEAVWSRGEPFTDFLQRQPEEGKPVSERTEVRIVLGEDALYVGARLFDRQRDQIRARRARRDNPSDSDYFVIHLDSRHDHLTAFSFAITPSGAFRDGAWGADGNFDYSWDPVWESATRIDDEGWTAEMRIPLSQLRFATGGEAVWGLQMARFIARRAELAQFAFVPLAETLAVARFGQLAGLQGLSKPRRIEALPHVVGRVEDLDVTPGNPFRGNRELLSSAGLDLKVGITSGLTLDASLNPDFGQVEVDPAVVNLTAFETYYPEQRPLFVEGSELFRFEPTGTDILSPGVGQIFYSRRIGRAPQPIYGGGGLSYLEMPQNTTIAGAMKLTGRVGERWSLGVLDAVTLEEKARYQDASGSRGELPVEPLTNYLVVRGRGDGNEGNTTMGGILTAVHRDMEDPTLHALLPGSALVGGLDFAQNWKNREWFLTGSLAGSRVTGSPGAIARLQSASSRYYQRPDAEHVAFDPDRTSLTGYRATLTAGRQAGEHWLGWLIFSARTPGWEVNDVGFEPQSDRADLALQLQRRETVPGRWWRYHRTDLLLRQTRNFDRDVVASRAMVAQGIVWNNFWQTTLLVDFRPSTVDDRMLRGGPLGRTPAQIQFVPILVTDTRRAHTAISQVRFLRTEHGGWGLAPQLIGTLRPSPALEFSFSPTYERIHYPAQWVRAVQDPLATHTHGARYVFADIDQHTLSLDTRVDFAFTPRITLQLYLQPFVATGAYTGFKEWLVPGRWGFAVYGRDRGTIQASPEGVLTIDPDGESPASPFLLPDPDFSFRSLRGNAVLRWEYRPGSTLYLVWQQGRKSLAPEGFFDFFHDYDALFGTPPENIFVIKASWWLGR